MEVAYPNVNARLVAGVGRGRPHRHGGDDRIHIGGDGGRDIFESPDDMKALFDELAAHPAPVELVLAGDFFDFLRIAELPEGANRVSLTIERPKYREVFDALRRLARGESNTVIYMPGNHDAEMWWNAEIRAALEREALVGISIPNWVLTYPIG